MNWLKEQWEWVKSFFSEPKDDDSLKGSMKRGLSFWIVITFMVSYSQLVARLEIKNGRVELPDVPFNWTIIICSIIGLGVVDKLVTNGTLAEIWKSHIEKKEVRRKLKITSKIEKDKK
jgi:hypothetical protein